MEGTRCALRRSTTAHGGSVCAWRRALVFVVHSRCWDHVLRLGRCRVGHVHRTSVLRVSARFSSVPSPHASHGVRRCASEAERAARIATCAVHATTARGEETPILHGSSLSLSRVGVVEKASISSHRIEIFGEVTKAGTETCPVGRRRWLRWPAALRRWPRPGRREEGEAATWGGKRRRRRDAGESDASWRDTRTKSDPRKKRTGRKLLKHAESKRSWLPKLLRCNSLNRRG